jgi:NitT/TauT family transport system permease protein
MSRPPKSLLRLLLVLAVLAAWEGAVRLFDIPAYIVPAPSKVFVALYRGIASMLYIRHLWITLIETLLGFVVGSIVALVLVQHPLNKLNI